MSAENNKKALSEQEFASEEQKKLIVQLYAETAYPKQYNSVQLNTLERELAGKHIEALISFKRSANSTGSAEQKVNGFDKISYAMIYKLCWKRFESGTSMPFPPNYCFKEWVFEEYNSFVESVAYAKAELAKKAGT